MIVANFLLVAEQRYLLVVNIQKDKTAQNSRAELDYFPEVA